MKPPGAERPLLRAALLCAVLALALSAWAEGAPPPKPIVLGVSNAQSGPTRNLGIQLVAGAQAYFSRINEKGGVHGRPIQMVIRDDRYEPEPALLHTRWLVEEGDALLLFGYVGTPTVTRTLPLLSHYFQSLSLVNLAPLTGSPSLRKPSHREYVLPLRATYDDEVRALINHLITEGHTRIGLLGQADAFGKTGEVAISDALKSRGSTVAGIATYRRNSDLEGTMTPQVHALRKKGVDAVIAFATAAPAAAFVRDSRLAGWDVPVALVSFGDADSFLTALRALEVQHHGDFQKNLITSQVVPLPDPASVTKTTPMVADYCAAVPSANRGFVSFEGWLNAVVAVEGLRRAEPSLTRLDVVRGFNRLNGWDPGLGTPLSLGLINSQGPPAVWLYKLVDGRWADTVKAKSRP